MTSTVVVGVDSSGTSGPALLWAARAAHDRHADLDLVHAVGHPMTAMDLVYDEEIRRGAEELLEKAAARVRESWPRTPVRTHVEASPAVHALADRSRSADLVVVGGTRGLGRVARALQGSTSYAVAAASRCPVVVVPQGSDDAGAGVVVGVDGSPDGVRAVALAAVEAERTGEELHVVHAWQRPAEMLGGDYYAPSFDDETLDRERVVLGESVAGLAADHPDLVVHQHLVRGHPATALLERAAGARLLVVGSHGRTALVRGLLGSVSHDVVLRATCPVLVARNRERVRTEHG